MHRFSLIPGSWAILKLSAEAPVPEWATMSKDFFAVTRTREELSVICPAADVPSVHDNGIRWSLIKVEGPFSFAEIGVLASFGTPLANAGISIIAVSTHDTDYILIRAHDEAAARQSLILAGHRYVTGNGGDT